MVVGVVARVEEMVVQGSMEPVVEELNRPHVKQHSDDGPISSPDRKEPDTRDRCIGQIELEPIEDDLVIPVYRMVRTALHTCIAVQMCKLPC
jgi:hypothetical protein